MVGCRGSTRKHRRLQSGQNRRELPMRADVNEVHAFTSPLATRWPAATGESLAPSPLVTEKIDEFLRREGTTDKVALNLIAFIAAQEFQLFLVFNSFRHDLEFQVMPNGNDGPHDSLVVRICGDIFDK